MQVEALIQKLMERDRDAFDFDSKIQKVLENYLQSPNALPREWAELLTIIPKMIFEAGYLAGVQAGLELSEEIQRELYRRRE